LANERTFAAWVRTGLSVAAAGIGVAHATVHEQTVKHWLTLMFIVLGSGMILFGGARFERVTRDLDYAGAQPVRLARPIVLVMVATLAVLVVSTFLVVG
jgi:inner membrane protein YidH